MCKRVFKNLTEHLKSKNISFFRHIAKNTFVWSGIMTFHLAENPSEYFARERIEMSFAEMLGQTCRHTGLPYFLSFKLTWQP